MIRVLIVDDQSLVRNVLEEELNKHSEIKVVGKASNAVEAKNLLPGLKPDLISLDVEMPGMSGLDFLDWLFANFPTPVIMLSSYTEAGAQTTAKALQKGASDFVHKPNGTEEDFLRMLNELTYKIKKIGSSSIAQLRSPFSEKRITTNESKASQIKLIAIGASTGGTQAIDFILNQLPNFLPPIVMVQHMPEHFTTLFANRLAQTSGLNVKEAANGDLLEDGAAYLAPGDHHLLVRKLAGKMYLEVEKFDKVSGHRPSVDVLFDSIARAGLASKSLGILLTGMGRDGANGLLAMKEKGARTIGQDASSSVVYGMPREAFELGAVEKQTSLNDIPSEILTMIRFK
ncbi:chemotaxis response regulator protein-glutamate methylesterase of group 1 operon [Leptospira kobayashii]|uniref:Protein-glutamate methylesterase/protein-glutamine glutaminase n=1 Tax=Leptospira kobayashii TaxID=1917830 RepID=A0ABM7UQV6_9LEPT|nr:chemotaxis response regulator protein-glutamate methylesterase [Leptospira kobayashii]BDA78034.1 chemotaxis response regulator protein-glutamate methylesterase of group 1 operon [Leptospira kobayashii]